MRRTDRMSDLEFKAMVALFAIVDFLFPYVARRASTFGICEGMTVVDYGCGPGRYTMRFAELVGEKGKVYAVDIQPLAIEAVRREVARLGIANVEAVLAKGYDSGLPERVADMVCAIDMFFGVREPKVFLGELRRIIKPHGILIIDAEHQSRRAAKTKLLASGYWRIAEEARDHLKCKPVEIANRAEP